MNDRIKEILEKMEKGKLWIYFLEFSYDDKIHKEFLKFVDHYTFFDDFYAYRDNVYVYSNGNDGSGNLCLICSLDQFKEKAENLINKLNKTKEISNE